MLCTCSMTATLEFETKDQFWTSQTLQDQRYCARRGEFKMESFSCRSEGLPRSREKNTVEEEEGERPPVHEDDVEVEVDVEVELEGKEEEEEEEGGRPPVHEKMTVVTQ